MAASYFCFRNIRSAIIYEKTHQAGCGMPEHSMHGHAQVCKERGTVVVVVK